MLADRIGRRSHLEGVQVGFVGGPVGVIKIDALAGMGPEEERGRRDALPFMRRHRRIEDIDPRLRIVPAVPVDHQIQLNGGDAVFPRSGRQPRQAGVGVRRAGPATH